MPEIEKIRVDGTNYDIRDAKVADETLADNYDPINGTYNVGEFCTHDLKVMKCTVAINTPEEWNPLHWTNSKVMSEIQNNSYTLPLASSSTRGGLQTGYTTNGTNYAVQLSGEKAFVAVPWTDTTYSDMGGATSSTAGTSGLVPAPSAGDDGKFLSGDGTWKNVSTTDTKNTAGATDTNSKIFLVGATSQDANPQTYSHDTAYVGTDGCLYSGGTKVLTAHQDISGKADDSAVVHKTGDETVGGAKTFTGTPNVKDNALSPSVQFTGASNSSNSGYIALANAGTGNTAEYDQSAFKFVEYSPSQDGSTRNNTYESYSLPTVDRNRQTSDNYQILTSKTPVTIAQGGTGASTASDALTNLGAASDSNVVHKTGAESINGDKTINNKLILKNDSQNPQIDFYGSNNSDASATLGFVDAGVTTGEGYSNPRLSITQYSSTSEGVRTDYYENYKLPTPDAGRTSSASYYILTSKEYGNVENKSSATILSELTGYTENGNNYAIKLANGKGYVTVPWSNTTYTAGTGLTLTGSEFSVSKQNVSDMINLLDTGTSNASSDDYIVAQYAGGGTTTTTYHRRKASSVVNATLVKSALGTNATHGGNFLRKDGTWVVPYTSEAASSGGTAVSLCTTGEKYTWNNKADNSSVVHNTGNENIGGEKTFLNNMTMLKVSDTATYFNFRKNTNTGGIGGTIVFDFGDSTNQTVNRFSFREYSPKTTADSANTTHFERYYLPAPTKGLSTDANYNILTTKDAVTVAQGGTGATTASGALTNLGAASDSNVVHKTGAEDVSGEKRFKDALKIGNSASNSNHFLVFMHSADSPSGRIYCASGSSTNQTSNRIIVQSYSPKTTPDATNTGYVEAYMFPAPDAGLSESKWYDILTSKSPVSITRGGTGGATASAARTNLGVPADSDVVHKTGDELIAGAKSFSSSMSITTSAQYKALFFKHTGASTECASIYVDAGHATNQSKNQMYFREFAPKSTVGTENTGKREDYTLPAPTAGLTENKTYSILTSKSAVTVAQGGTGGTSAATARSNLGVPADTAVVHNSGAETVAGDKTFSGVISFTKTTDSSSTTTGAVKISGGLGVAKNIYGNKVYNAVWNDYAECRQADIVEAGYCVTETSSGVMTKTTERLQPGCKITSDTFGACMGQTETARTPIAVAGRVLAYPFRDISEFHLGDAVCSAPDGKIDVMTREEIREYPERIVGTVSEIPSYDVWQGGTKDNPQPVHVNGRIWIYVR